MHNPAAPLYALRESRRGKRSKREQTLARHAFISESADFEYPRKDIKRKHTDDTTNPRCRQGTVEMYRLTVCAKCSEMYISYRITLSRQFRVQASSAKMPRSCFMSSVSSTFVRYLLQISLSRCMYRRRISVCVS